MTPQCRLRRPRRAGHNVRRGGSSVGQSKGLIIPGSWVRAPPAPPPAQTRGLDPAQRPHRGISSSCDTCQFLGRPRSRKPLRAQRENQLAAGQPAPACHHNSTAVFPEPLRRRKPPPSVLAPSQPAKMIDIRINAEPFGAPSPNGALGRRPTRPPEGAELVDDRELSR